MSAGEIEEEIANCWPEDRRRRRRHTWFHHLSAYSIDRPDRFGPPMHRAALCVFDAIGSTYGVTDGAEGAENAHAKENDLQSPCCGKAAP